MNKFYSIHYTSSFELDLQKIQLYSLFSLEDFYFKFNKIISYLKYFPEIFPRYNNYNYIINVRKIPIGDFLIFYEVNHFKKEIYILHIFYSKQDYLNLL